MNRVAISIGKFNIYWYSIFILIAMIVATILIIRESRKSKIKEEFTINLLFYGFIIGIIGARLYYILFNLDYYLNNIGEIIAIWNGGLAIYGGIITTLLFIIIYSKKNNLNVLKTTDICVISLIIGQAIGRWGNFFNREAYGKITTLTSLKSIHLPQFIIDGMFIEGSYREPLFLYESTFCLLGFIVLILVRKLYKELKLGQLTSIYLVWYGILRLIIEHFRSDSLMLGIFKISQIISIIFILSGIILFIYSIKKKKPYNIDKEGL